MGVQLGQINLSSHHQEQLASFLSEVFDATAKVVGEDIMLDIKGVSFCINKRAKRLKSIKNSNIVAEFFLESPSELDEIHRKIEFMAYRHPELEIEREDIVECESKRVFSIRDADQREWKFSSPLTQ